ncbi:Formate/nitrite transporter FocA, FNT family [Fibrobacter sp. UWT2]|uniref:formate/nitrite transporter family protein n=1 Tax=Fibrobacter sp. UWT2 TaxID=1896224 RepID=UPI00090FFDEF|nr:formate/nitrite transporter family protein [Fibrobacter sp. UWT2]SHK48277.1 Formate/nitrite transporter FocA, FNT family [Fibrobacter sp. UWT2]
MIKNLILSIYSGLCIGLGGTAYLSCDNKVLGSFLFGLGLFTILNFGFNLFTGKVGYFVNNKPSYWEFLGIVWLGNFIGTFLFARMIALTRYGAPLQAKASALCLVKDGDSIVSLLILGIFCGMLMFIAADGYKSIENQVGKVVVVFLPVMVFILSGFEHCIADMFYFSLAGDFSALMFKSLVVITIGNSIGGGLIPLARRQTDRRTPSV